ncbi:hypothetical protein LR48_Vigan10g125200 [Vigna angularis]|uniref:Uncharacterized protein n=1 Tax=Phaseolus angularis TaxID=3914 RepID=A0A0L9VJY0_PHAAN|nr:hypothetical protein LR48_Vigan10g125200 [Vigna angularis]
MVSLEKMMKFAVPLVKLLSVELVKCCYGDRGNSRFILGVSKEMFGRESSFVKYSEEVFILREVFGGGVHPL